MEDAVAVEVQDTGPGRLILPAINHEYHVTESHMKAPLQTLADRGGQYWTLSESPLVQKARRVVAISKNLRAVSEGTRILVTDIESNAVRCRFAGTGRTATALAFSPHDTHILVSGHIDGSVVIWNLKFSGRTSHHNNNFVGTCHAVQFSPLEPTLLATIHNDAVAVWKLDARKLSLICKIQSERVGIDAIAWHRSIIGTLVVATLDAELRIYDVAHALIDSHTQNFAKFDTENDGYSTQFPVHVGLENSARLIAKSKLETPLRYVAWLSQTTLIGLAPNRQNICIYKNADNGKGLAKVWSKDFSLPVHAVHIYLTDTALLCGSTKDGVELYSVPEEVSGSIGQLVDSKVGPPPFIAQSKEVATVGEASLPVLDEQPTSASTEAGMRPVSIQSQRTSSSAFAKTSKQLQSNRRISQQKSLVGAPSRDIMSHRRPPSTPPQSHSMTSSLELPKRRGDGDDEESSMPFLSPTIPSRKASPNEIPPLDMDASKMDTLPLSSFPSSPTSTAGATNATQDSDDSDDETFVEAMQGSAPYLPGGINVPLPKACGALFAQNGQLLIFFPPRPRPVSTQGSFTVGNEDRKGGQERTVLRLFPTFGNLISGSNSLDSDSDSEDSVRLNGVARHTNGQRRLTTTSAFFPDQWGSQRPFVKRGIVAEESPHRIVVSVHEVNDVEALYPEQRKLAEEYRVLCDADQTGADLCEYNATAARAANILDVAEIWSMLAMLLQDKVPLEVLSLANDGDDVLLVAKRIKNLARSDSGVSLSDLSDRAGTHGKLRWADHPLGGAWLVRQILRWAEQRADMQFLACVSAILTESQERLPNKHVTAEKMLFTRLPTFSRDYFADETLLNTQQKAKRQIPLLRTNSITKPSSMYESPKTLHQNSNTSSRHASNPSTPYLESTSITPPFAMSSLSRQSTVQSNMLSTAGSSSPEQLRSSFSAAARSYAQSVTDKFASSFGTSPPIRKTGTSPGTSHELSTSFPGGSWPGKSVSFASTTTSDTTRGSMLSSSYDAKMEGVAYDSDRTIEDNNMPYIPKSPGGPIAVTLKNQDRFADEVSGCARAKLVPEDLFAMTRSWCQYYAEQLRSWNLVFKAAELEKVAGITSLAQNPSVETDLSSGGPLLEPMKRSGSRVCSICQSSTPAVEQICPSCLHCSHISCLADYSQDLDLVEFTCPTGCGCTCSDLWYAEQEWIRSPEVRPAFKKQASFTDPRRWRARVEGDSW